MEECLFCKIGRGDIPSEEVYSDDEFYAFRDVNPQAPVHVLVIPREHVPRVTDFNAKDIDLLGKLILTGNKIAEAEGLVSKGFRFVLNCNDDGGQTVLHLHLHILGGRRMGWPPG